jgi:hypothetical protein
LEKNPKKKVLLNVILELFSSGLQNRLDRVRKTFFGNCGSGVEIELLNWLFVLWVKYIDLVVKEEMA